MKIIESEFSNLIVKSEQFILGDIHFFNHIAVIEFNEGVHIDTNNLSEISKKLLLFFGISIPFGIISNRINSYSINLLDIKNSKKTISNFCAYGVISHNPAGAMNANLESNFCSQENIHFNNIAEAVTFVYSKVKSKILYSLN